MNYEVLDDKEARKKRKEREGQKGRMNKRARVDERVELTEGQIRLLEVGEDFQ